MSRHAMKSVAVVVTVLLLIAVHGCGGAASVAGTYELDKEGIKAEIRKEIDAASPEEKPMMEAMSGMVMGMIDSMSMTITLNADGTATGNTNVPMEGASTASGTWTLSGDSITISMAESGETPESMTGTIKDGVITIKNPDDEMTIILRKR